MVHHPDPADVRWHAVDAPGCVHIGAHLGNCRQEEIGTAPADRERYEEEGEPEWNRVEDEHDTRARPEIPLDDVTRPVEAAQPVSM